MGTNLIKCPKCGGPVNKLWLSSVDHLKNVAVFVAECWSGDLKKRSHYHIFLVSVKLAGKVEHGDEVITVSEELARALEAGNIDVEETLRKAVEIKGAEEATA